MKTKAWLGRWREVLLLALLWAVSPLAFAQTYTYQTDTFSWLAPSGAATTVTWDNTCTSYPNGDDVQAVVNFPSGFTFNFANTVYSQVRIISNGMIQFGADSGIHRVYSNTTLPAAQPGASNSGCARSVPQNLLVAYWVDINTAPNIPGAPVQYELVGTAPNRRFVITFNNVALYGNAATRYSFQVVLNEDNTFKYQYTVGASDGSAGTVGVQVSGADYTQYSFKQTFIDPSSGSAIKWYRADQAQPKRAEYFFDESTWQPSPVTDIRDASGNALHGARIGNALSSAMAFKVCRANAIPANTANNVQDAVSIPITPASVGSVSFWYLPSANSDAMLFDASTVANGPFFLMKTAAGQLKMTISDSAGAIVSATTTGAGVTTANGWRHIAVSWYMQSGINQTVLRMYVNGVMQGVWRGTTNGSPGAVSNFYIGDNRTAGITPSGGTPNSANGYIDEMKLYPFDMSNVQALKDMILRAGCSSLDHFDVSINPVAALTCEWVSVSITARDSIGGAVQSSTTATLSSSSGHGDWLRGTASGVFTPGTAGSGNASYTFNNESSATLLFNSRWAETATLGVNASPASGSSSVAFAHAGFKFVTASMMAATVGNKVACVDSDLGYVGPPAQTAQPLYLQAWKSDQSTFVCSAASQDFASGKTATINFSMQCANPGICTSGTNATVNATTVGLSPTGAGHPATAEYKPVSLTFGANAMAPIRFNYPDAGQVQLWASYNPPGVPSNHMNGVSNTFVVAPAAFVFTSVKSSSGTANPINWPSLGAPTLSTANFTHAGDSLSIALQAVNACSTPGVTGNFGNESTSPNNTRHGGGTFSMNVGAGNAMPAINVPALVNSTAPVFANGVTTTPAVVRWDEVGAFKGTILLSDYFGMGNVRGTSDWIGRFYPHHFDTQIAPATGCAAFAYSGQPFTVLVTAKNGVTPAAGTTQNYHGAATFSRSVSLSEETGAAGSLYVGATIGGSNALPSTVFVNGVGTILYSATSLPSPISFRFTTSPTVPTNILVNAEDSDTLPSKATNGGANGAIAIRSGRLALNNAYGSELLSLSVPAKVQHWTAAGWMQNLADSCTVLTVPSNINGGLTNVLNSKTTANLASPVVGGDVRLRLSMPGTGNAGLVDISGIVLRGVNTWLTLPASSARACFGVCGPRSPVIYFRENY